MDDPTTGDERVQRARAMLGAYDRDGVAPGYWDALAVIRGLLQVVAEGAR